MINNIQKGKKGEEIAAQYLIESGYRIIERNWHYSKNAEIDIIAQDNETIVFVEVKTRTSLGYGHPFEAINANKIKKVHTAILGYLNSSKKKYKSFRFDGIAVIGLSDPKIEHLKNLGQY
ncbi:MAG: YraN family protein [Candidatus Avigastranaerophilus sp.]